MKKSSQIIEVYPDAGNQWRWRKRARRGGKRIVSCSGESFYSKGNALRAARAEARGMRDQPEIKEALK